MSTDERAGEAEEGAAPVGREPWLAALLSGIWPGVGQMHAGEPTRGAWLAAAYLAAAITFGWHMVAERGDMRIAVVAVLAMSALAVGSMVDAHHRVRDANAPEFEEARRRQPDPWKAAWLSRVVPGLGHFYIGRRPVGIAFLIGAGAIALVRPKPVGDVLYTALAIAAVGLAYLEAPVRRESSSRAIVAIGVVIFAMSLGALAATGWFRSNVAQAFRVPSESMLPTLRPGDYVWVARGADYVPRRRDLLTYRPSDHPETAMVKRVVGLPGDTLELRDKVLWVNGLKLFEPYAWHADSTVYPANLAVRDNYGPVVVPEDAWFVLGDNRDNSNDSRMTGFVAAANVIGRAYRIYWPLDRAGALRWVGPVPDERRAGAWR